MEGLPSYPFINGFVKHGKLMAVLVAVIVILAGAYAAYRSGMPDWFAIGAIASLAAYGVMRLLVEIVQVIAETLLPR